MECSFALLSGGNSRRFNDDKTKALLFGKPIYEYGLECGLSIASQVMHISKDKAKYKPFMENVEYIEDELNVVCPMSGLITAARYAKYDNMFILSADSPLITGKFFKYLYSKISKYDGVVPVMENRQYPLAAVYKRKVLLSMEEDYNNNEYKLMKSLQNHNILYIQEDEIISSGFNKEMFININYKDDLKLLEENHG